MTNSSFLDEQLQYIYLSENIEKSIEKIDMDKLKMAIKSKNIKKAFTALKSVPDLDIKSIKNVAEKRVRNFKKYYMEAESAAENSPEDVKETVSTFYATMRSIGENASEAGKAFGKLAEKLLDYIFKHAGMLSYILELSLVMSYLL
jgi:hypothetical protein